MTRQCSSCGSFCKKSGCECENVPIITSSDVIAGLQMALSQAEAMIERQQHVMQRAMAAWDSTTHQKNGDGRLWQCMEELRAESHNRDVSVTKREMLLYHATTPKKVQHYHASGRIIAPVRGFTTLQAAMAWACKTGRSVVLAVQGEDCHKLPDHHNQYGEAWWVDHDVLAWKCVFSPKDA